MLTKDFFKNHPELLVLNSDRGSNTMVLNRTDHSNKMNELLSDSTTYIKINNDPTSRFQKTNNDLVDSWQRTNLLDKDIVKSLKINNAVPSSIYGLPKIHKVNIPLRPVVSTINSPFYKLSSFLSQSIGHILSNNDYHVKHSLGT